MQLLKISLIGTKLNRNDLHAVNISIDVIRTAYFFPRKLRHPNLLMLMGYCKMEDELWIISPYINGSDLEKLVFGNPPPFEVYIEHTLTCFKFDLFKNQ